MFNTGSFEEHSFFQTVHSENTLFVRKKRNTGNTGIRNKGRMNKISKIISRLFRLFDLKFFSSAFYKRLIATDVELFFFFFDFCQYAECTF